MFVNIIGLAYFFRMLLRMGLVQSSKAAPEGSLEASTEPRSAAEAEQAECQQCPICLEDFAENDAETWQRWMEPLVVVAFFWGGCEFKNDSVNMGEKWRSCGTFTNPKCDFRLFLLIGDINEELDVYV